MVTELRRTSPLYAAFDANRELITRSITIAVTVSAAKLGTASSDLYSLKQASFKDAQQLKAA